jgi:hypothetical protein
MVVESLFNNGVSVIISLVNKLYLPKVYITPDIVFDEIPDYTDIDSQYNSKKVRFDPNTKTATINDLYEEIHNINNPLLMSCKEVNDCVKILCKIKQSELKKCSESLYKFMLDLFKNQIINDHLVYRNYSSSTFIRAKKYLEHYEYIMIASTICEHILYIRKMRINKFNNDPSILNIFNECQNYILNFTQFNFSNQDKIKLSIEIFKLFQYSNYNVYDVFLNIFIKYSKYAEMKLLFSSLNL